MNAIDKLIDDFQPNVPSIIDVSSQSKDFHPTPYDFKINDNTNQSVGDHDVDIKSPPFGILFDHTLSVIWCAFARQYLDNLDISQVEWARKFTESVLMSSPTADTDHILSRLDDLIIEKYAEESDNYQTDESTDYPISLTLNDMLRNNEDVYESLVVSNKTSTIKAASFGLQQGVELKSKNLQEIREIHEYLLTEFEKKYFGNLLNLLNENPQLLRKIMETISENRNK